MGRAGMPRQTGPGLVHLVGGAAGPLGGDDLRLDIEVGPDAVLCVLTVAASVALPAFMLGHDPTRRIICASYSGELAHKHSNDFRAVLGSPWYRTIFPDTRIGPYKDSETEIELTRRGFRLATSVGGQPSATS